MEKLQKRKEQIKLIYDYEVTNLKGEKVSLKQFAGKVLLIVNTATRCGFTSQYEQLQKLYEKYKDKGLEILDFPCNQFLEQAPESNDEIQMFCERRYATTFPRFSKIDVNGANTIPLYAYLKQQCPKDIEDEKTADFKKKLEQLGQVFPNSEIKWNFTKFLVNREGDVIARFAPTCEPKDLETHIEILI